MSSGCIVDTFPSKPPTMCYISSPFSGWGSPLCLRNVCLNTPLSATFKCWLMAEIQAPEDSVSFSDCVNLEMSKFFSVLLPIVKKEKSLSVPAQRAGPLVPLLNGSVLWGCSRNDAKHQSLYFCFILCAFFK